MMMNSKESLEKLLKVAKASNHMGFTIYNQLSSKENIAFSPISISFGLSMVYLGAQGSTPSLEMRDVMGFERENLQEDDIHATNKEILKQLTSHSEKYTLHMGSMVLVTSRWSAAAGLHGGYKFDLKPYYDVELIEVDSDEKKEEVQMYVNAWVTDKTKGKINNVYSQLPTPNTSLVLLNVVYFKGFWEKPFDRYNTRPSIFYNSGTEVKEVPTMHKKAGKMYTFSKKLNCKLLEMPYSYQKSSDRPLSMVFILPEERNGLKDLQSKLTAETFQEAIKFLRFTDNVSVKIPKFKLEKEYQLEEVRRNPSSANSSGSSSVPGSGSSDLSGISEETPYPYVSKVIHKVIVEVDEGISADTLAASASLMDVRRGSSPYRQPPPPEIKFHIDHPFMFVIRDRETSLILFVGSVSKLNGMDLFRKLKPSNVPNADKPHECKCL